MKVLILVGFDDIGCDIRVLVVKVSEMLDFAGLVGIFKLVCGLTNYCMDLKKERIYWF